MQEATAARRERLMQEFGVEEGSGVRGMKARAEWSSARAVPAVGAVVHMGLGRAEVLGYFVLDGFLACLVQPLDPPAWYRQQNGGECPACEMFGVDMAQVSD